MSIDRRRGLYLDTSALGRVLFAEPGHQAVTDALRGFPRRVSSRLLRIELRRLARRRDAVERAEELLLMVALVPLDEATLTSAETVPPAGLATLDAIHLATAVRLAEVGLIATVLTYDHRLADGAQAHGLEVLAPA